MPMERVSMSLCAFVCSYPIPIWARPLSSMAIWSSSNGNKSSSSTFGKRSANTPSIGSSQGRCEVSSTASVNRCSTPAAISPESACKFAHASMMCLASSRRRFPSAVSAGYRPLRSNNETPKSASRLATAVLMTDWALPRRRAAAENDPVCAAASNACSCSMEKFIYLFFGWYITSVYLPHQLKSPPSNQWRKT